MQVVALIFTILLVSPTLSSGCGFLDLPCKVRGYFSGVEQDASGNLLAALKQAENDFINNVLPNIVRQVTAMADGVLSEASKDAEAIVNDMSSQMEELIKTAAAQAILVEDHATDDILKVINTALSQITILEEKLVQDANGLLDRIDTLIDKASCVADGVTGSILSATRAAADDGLIPNPFEPCRKEQDLGFRRVASLDNYSLYKFFKCRILEKIDGKTSLQDILGYLGEGQRTAAQFRCMSRSSPEASQGYTREFIQWGEWYDAWSPSSNGYSLDDVANSKEATPRLRVTLGKASPSMVDGRPLTNTVSLNQVSDTPAACGNMFDCYTQAMEALKEAQSGIASCRNDMTSLRTDISSLQSSMEGALVDIASNKGDLFDIHTAVDGLQSAVTHAQSTADAANGPISALQHDFNAALNRLNAINPPGTDILRFGWTQGRGNGDCGQEGYSWSGQSSFYAVMNGPDCDVRWAWKRNGNHDD